MRTFSLNKGFSLFEIMIVLVIIGLIMAIAMPNYIAARAKAEKNICISNQKIIYTAATMYSLKEPTELSSFGHDERLNELIDKGYIRGDKWLECPSSGDKSNNDYTLVFDGEGVIADVQCDRNPSEHVWP